MLKSLTRTLKGTHAAAKSATRLVATKPMILSVAPSTKWLGLDDVRIEGRGMRTFREHENNLFTISMQNVTAFVVEVSYSEDRVDTLDICDLCPGFVQVSYRAPVRH